MIIFWNVAGVVLAYLIGSIPTSVWIGRMFFRTDIREYGSKNAGATNAIRVLGLKAGILVLVIDVLKGWAAVKLAYLFGNNLIDNEVYFINFQIILGVASLVGHIFPVYVNFRGGKGIATLLGVAIAVFPYAILIPVGLFLIIFLLTKYVSLGSIVSSVTFPFILIFGYGVHTPLLVIFSAAIALFVPITHRKNIKRLMKGEESKTRLKNKKD